MNNKNLLQQKSNLALNKSEHELALDKSDHELVTFYQKPSFENFRKVLADSIKAAPPASFYLVQAFTTMAIDNHPDYIVKIKKGFTHFSPKEKELFYTAFIATQNKNMTDYLKNNFHYNINVTSKYTVQDIKNIQINDNLDNLDLSWAAFFATGDNLYLQKIIQYVNLNDYILISAYEIVNRNYISQFLSKLTKDNKYKNGSYIDIIEGIKKQYPGNSKQMLNKASVVATALISLELNRKDAVIEKKYEKIINANPNLDYWKKIHRALGK